jgi:hypothetical protein
MKSVRPQHLSSLPSRRSSWYSFPLEDESTPGRYCDRKDYVNEKSPWPHWESNTRPSSLLQLKDYNQQKYLTFIIFYLTLITHFQHTFPILITADSVLFMRSKFTTNADNVTHLNQQTHGLVWSWNSAPTQSSGGGSEWSDRHQNCVGRVSLHFHWEMNTIGILSVPQR